MTPEPNIHPLSQASPPRSSQRRQIWDSLFLYLCLFTACASVLILAFLLGSIFYQGFPQLSWRLLTNATSSDPEKAGYYPALWGTIWICTICGMLSLPIGIGTAILLEEFAPRNRFLLFFHGLIRLNITNLAGVPSVVYGILGLTAFAATFGLFKDRPWELGVRYYDQFLTEDSHVVLVPVASPDAPETVPSPDLLFLDSTMKRIAVRVVPARGPLPKDLQAGEMALRANEEPGRLAKKRWYYVRFPLGKGVLTGGLTLMLVVLPIVIIASQEALRSVPSALREGAQGLGATSWQVVWNVTLPAALPGMLTGAILAMSRAIGEAAPILIISGVVYILNAPDNLMADFTAMPLQIYNWTSQPQKEYHFLAASGIILLLVILFAFNSIAVLIRYRLQRPLS